MKKTLKIIHFLDRMEDMAVLIGCLILFLIGLYGLYDSYLVYRDANDSSLLKNKPGYEGETIEKEIKGNMVAWLTLDDTKVDYPVMQGDDNTEYLNKNPYGEYSLSGSLFLDSRNSDQFQDPYSLIYGHHMEHGMMFGALDAYLDETYFQEHRTGELIVGDTTYTIHIFAVLETDATNEFIFAPTEVAETETLAFIQKNAVFYEQDFETGAPILGMSTCKYPDTAERTIVFGTLVF